MQLLDLPLLALQLQLLRRKKMSETPVPVYITNSAEWEYLRPIITNLYVDEDKKLDELMKEIEIKHGFKAT
jgi:hypothetical protein